MDELDKKLKLFFSRDIELSNKYKNSIDRALYKKEKSTIYFKRFGAIRTLATACIGIVIITGVVFAKTDIYNNMKNFFNSSKGLDKAIENGYIEEPNMEYIESNGTKIAVENMLMDDFNLSFTVLIDLENNILANELARIRFPDMIITDENNKILYCDNRVVFENYCKNNNLNYEYTEFSDDYINTGGNWYIKNKYDNKVELIYNLYANTFPKSKKIFINLSQIACSKNEISENEEIILTGNWNINLDIPEKFYNREAIVYTVKYCSDPSLNITEATLYNTGMRFEFKTQVNPIYDESDSQEIKDKKFKIFSQWYSNNVKSEKSFINDEYIEDEKGTEFYPLKSSTEDARTSYLVNGDFIHWQTFNLTKYEMTDKIKIYFNINLPYENKDVFIELERNSN